MRMAMELGVIKRPILDSFLSGLCPGLFAWLKLINSMNKSGEHFAPPFSLFTIYTS